MKQASVPPVFLLLSAIFQATVGQCQYRLDQYTALDPVKGALVQADGSSLFALQLQDTAVVLRVDAQGQPQWALEVADPGNAVVLLESSDSTITRIDGYAPITPPNPPWQDDTVEVRVRVARLNGSGDQLWSKTVTTSFVHPYEFTLTHVQLSGVSTSDNGTIISVLAYSQSIGP